METIEKTFLSNRAKRIVFVLCTFILFYLVSFLIDPYGEFWENYLKRDLLDLAAEWQITFIFCFLVAEASLVIHNRLNKSFPWIENPAKRLLFETGLNIIAVFLFIVFNILCIYLIYNKTEPAATALSAENINGLSQWIVVSLVISFMITAFNTGSYLLNNWKYTDLQVIEQKLRVSELKQASVQAQLNALQLQIDPHFIFNNLSVLSELILESPNVAYDFSENFSKVYRFLLVNSRKNLISVQEEMKFLQAYIFLIEHRIGNGVQFDLSVDDALGDYSIPPLTLQLLVENALKHNSRNKNQPLQINIYNDSDNNIIVENTLAPLEHPAPHSTGTGLSNIRGRFNLLGNAVPEIRIEEGLFKVVIQLVPYDK